MSEHRLRYNRIGVLTSGGDCAGLNAAIRAVVLRAHSHGLTVIGILAATAGLLERPLRFIELEPSACDVRMLRRGGTILETVNKGNPFAYPMPDGSVADRSEEAIAGFRALNLDALIGIGGDGSLRILARLAEQGGIPFIGVPKTIDNDVAETDWSIGYMTAVEAAVDALDRLAPTAASHRRVMVLEVMGRDVGWIALAAGIAGGADVILVPEIPFDPEIICERLRDRYALGHNHALVVCAEGIKLCSGEAVYQTMVDGEIRHAGAGQAVADLIANATGAETRVTVLGHVQRGGAPCAFDRILASALGSHAVDLVVHGKTNRVVIQQKGKTTDVPLSAVAGKTRALKEDNSLMQVARRLNICLGDNP
ncbi:MAG: ATP-dependent 6-phosphofructokinase [Rhodospirillales bacterium]|jgi:6-phosphofructokinase 1|nr:ATP-dependent 6-phosphofructokinase [Rhodospirillales bacterium]